MTALHNKEFYVLNVTPAGLAQIWMVPLTLVCTRCLQKGAKKCIAMEKVSIGDFLPKPMHLAIGLCLQL